MKQMKKVKLWSRDFILIILISLTTAIVMQVLNATMTLYAASLGAKPTYYGTMAILFAFTASATRLISGNLSDRLSRRLFMVIGSSIFALSVFAFGMISLLPAMLVFRAIQGVGFSSVNTASATAVIDLTPKSRIGEGLGYYSLSMAIASAVGPLFGLLLANRGQFKLLYNIMSVILLLCLIFSIMSSYEIRQKKMLKQNRTVDLESGINKQNENYRGIWNILEKNALPASSLYMLLCFSTACIISFLPLYAKEQGIKMIVIFYLVEAIAMFTVRILTGKVFDRRGPLPVLIPSLILGTIAFVMFNYIGSGWTFLIPAALYGSSNGMALPVFNALAVKDAPKYRRGVASATFMLFVDIGLGVGGMIWGILLDLTAKDYSMMFTGAAVCQIIALMISVIIFRKYKVESQVSIEAIS